MVIVIMSVYITILYELLLSSSDMHGDTHTQYNLARDAHVSATRLQFANLVSDLYNRIYRHELVLFTRTRRGITHLIA